MNNRSESTIDQPRNPMNRKRGLRRLVSAARYSLAGIRAAWQTEEAFRQEATLAIVMLPAAAWLGSNAAERLLLAGSVLLVLIVELLNTAVEYTVDRISTDHHELSGRAKDMGSAAVMLTLILTILVWGSVAWTRFFR